MNVLSLKGGASQAQSPPASAKPADQLVYEDLLQEHAEYDRKLFTRIEDLYEAGWKLLGKAKDYLPKAPAEKDKDHDYRCQTATCLPYFAQIVDQFASNLFSQPLNITPAGDAKDPTTPGEYPDEDYYTKFSKDADGGGQPLLEILSSVVKTGLKLRRAYLFVDAPDQADDAPTPANRADEDASGLNRCYVYELPPLELIDWKTNKQGEYEWCVTHSVDQARESPATPRNQIRETFTVWTCGDGDSSARWARYVIEYDPKNPPQAKDMVKLEAHADTSFPRIPILKLEFSKGLWVGNKVGTQQLEHWRRRSELVSSESKSCHAILTTFLAPEMSGAGFNLPSEAQTNPNRATNPRAEFNARGAARMGAEDRLEFVEPEGKAYTIIHTDLDNLKDEMFRVVHMMAASVKNTPSSLGRSGLSKQKDGEATAAVLTAIGEKVRGLAVRIYDTISKARDEDVVWVPHGLDMYEVDDREQVLEEAVSMQLVDIPSPTLKKEHAKRVSSKLVPNLPPATVAQINQEIDTGVEALEKVAQIEQKAHIDEVLNPPAPVIAGGKPAMPPKAPAAKTAAPPGKKP
jgi:hypothetical protein